MDKRLVRQNRVVLVIGATLVFVAAAVGQTPPSGQKTTPESKTDPKINAAFQRPDVKAYIKRFESDDREVLRPATRDRRGHGTQARNECG